MQGWRMRWEGGREVGRRLRDIGREGLNEGGRDIGTPLSPPLSLFLLL